MKNDELDPSAAVAAIIQEQEELNISGLHEKIWFNEELEEIEDQIEDVFAEMYASVKGLEFRFHGQMKQKGVFDSKSLTKTTLATWLEKVTEALHQSRHVMRNVSGTLSKLKSEKIEDKETIIRLQSEIIKKQSSEFSAVQDTVKTEMKSYSQIAMKKSAAPAITQKQLKTVVREAVAQDDRSKNVIVFGLEEEAEEDLGTKIGELMEDLGEKPQLIDCKRLGKAATKKPVKVTLRSPDVARQILANSRKLRQIAGRKTVFVCPDRTPEEREFYSKLNEEMKKKMKDDPGRYYFIRNKKICHVDRKPPDEA